MVDEILRLLSSDPGKKIKYLVIIGHGSPGKQRVGPGSRDGDHNLALKEVIDLAPVKKGEEQKLADPGESQLNRLRGWFHPNAVVTLGGCSVAGLDEFPWGVIDGKNLLKGVSKALGYVMVQGGEQLQMDLVAGIEGNCIRCRGDALWVAKGTGYWGPGDNAELSSLE